MAANAQTYFVEKNVNTMLESIVADLAFHRPEDPVAFMQQRLLEIKLKMDSGKKIQVVPQELMAQKEAADAKRSMLIDLNRAQAQQLAKSEVSVPIPAPSVDSEHVVVGTFRADRKHPNMISEIARAVQDQINAPQQTVQASESKIESVSAETKSNEDVVTESVVEPAPRQLEKTVFVLGGPGSGKGTQCAKLIEEFGYAHVSVGDLLRVIVAQKTEVGMQMDEIMKEGKLVPGSIVMGILKNHLTSLLASGKGVLIDGFPRELAQAIDFEKNIGLISTVIYYECSPEAMKVRLLKRGETSGRSDDNEESIGKRLNTFFEQTVPVAEYFEKSGKLVRIRSDQGAPDEVYAATRVLFL